MNIDIMVMLSVILIFITWAFLITVLVMLFFRGKTTKKSSQILSRISVKINELGAEIARNQKSILKHDISIAKIMQSIKLNEFQLDNLRQELRLYYNPKIQKKDEYLFLSTSSMNQNSAGFF